MTGTRSKAKTTKANTPVEAALEGAAIVTPEKKAASQSNKIKPKAKAPTSTKEQKNPATKTKQLKVPKKAKKPNPNGKKGPSSNKKAKHAKSLSGGFRTKPANVPSNPVKKGNLQFYERSKAGVTVVHYMKSSDSKEPKAAFMVAPFDVFDNDASFRNKHKLYAVVPRRLSNQSDETIKQEEGSKYDWMCALVITGTDGNKPSKVDNHMKELAVAVNNITTKKTDKQVYPQKTHHAGDLTPSTGPRALDNFIMDDMVLELLKDAYSNHSLEVISTHDDVLADYFTNVERGREVIRSSMEEDEEEEEDEDMAEDSSDDDADASDDEEVGEDEEEGDDNQGEEDDQDGDYEDDADGDGDDGDECAAGMQEEAHQAEDNQVAPEGGHAAAMMAADATN